MDIQQLKQRIDASGKKLVMLGNECARLIQRFDFVFKSIHQLCISGGYSNTQSSDVGKNVILLSNQFILLLWITLILYLLR